MKPGCSTMRWGCGPDAALRILLPLLTRIHPRAAMHAMPAVALHPSGEAFVGQSMDNSLQVYFAGDRVRALDEGRVGVLGRRDTHFRPLPSTNNAGRTQPQEEVRRPHHGRLCVPTRILTQRTGAEARGRQAGAI